MAAPPYMPLYIGDYLSDTRHLSTEAHGAYLLLLMAMWRAGGRLPNEGAKLARIVGLTPSKWAKLEADVLSFFEVCGDELGHKRIAKEFEKYTRTCERRKEAGAKGGAAKSLKNNVVALASANDLPEQLPEQKAGNQNQNQNQNQDSSVVPPDGETTGGEPPPDLDREAWTGAVELLTQQGGMTEKQARSLFGKLLSAHGLEARDMLGPVAEARVNRTRDPQGYLTRSAISRAKRRGAAQPQKRVGFV